MSAVRSRVSGGTVLVVLSGVLIGLWISGPASYGDSGVAIRVLGILPLFLLSFVALTSLHETAHATVGRLVGWQIFGMTIGQGRRHATVRLGSFRLDLRGLLIGGVTIGQPTGSRWRDAAMLSAGITVETTVVVVVLTRWPDGGWATTAAWAIVLAAGIDIVTNLWPRRVDIGPVTGMSTDGAQLLSILTTPDQLRHDIRQMNLTPARAELVQALHGGDIEDALALARTDADSDPDDETAQALLGTLLLLSARWREAYDHLVPLADAPDADPLLANNAAWAAVMTFEPSLLPTAERLSAHALLERPTEPACANTRGSTLVLLGRTEEGLRLLQLAADGRLSRSQKAFVFAFLALAEHRSKRYDAARSHLAMSESLDGECAALPEIRRLLVQPVAPIAPPAALASWPPVTPPATPPVSADQP